MEKLTAHKKLVEIVSRLANEQRDTLERLKANYTDIERYDFLWHYLLTSFSTMGKAAGWHGLIGNKENYDKLIYETLESMESREREEQIHKVCRSAGIRMPDLKASYIIGCFRTVKQLGGPKPAKSALMSQKGHENKIRFLKKFPGIGDKYARNIMMDVYHEDFRNCIAIDIRIKAISNALGLSFSSYAEHEQFYLSVARDAGVNGWELDRLLFNFRSEIEGVLRNDNNISPSTIQQNIHTEDIVPKSVSVLKDEKAHSANGRVDERILRVMLASSRARERAERKMDKATVARMRFLWKDARKYLDIPLEQMIEIQAQYRRSITGTPRELSEEEIAEVHSIKSDWIFKVTAGK